MSLSNILLTVTSRLNPSVTRVFYDSMYHDDFDSSDTFHVICVCIYFIYKLLTNSAWAYFILFLLLLFFLIQLSSSLFSFSVSYLC